MTQKNNKGLGKGLQALLAGISENEEVSNNENLTLNGIQEINCDNVLPNPYQPRKYFDNESLNDLAHNIKEYGVIQPIVVTKLDDNTYQLIAGERRLRASKLADLSTIPAIIKNISEKHQAIIALIENLQRQDLNCIEEAQAFSKLYNEFKFTHEEIANQINKSRSHVTNLMRLLSLSSEVQDMLTDRKIDMGHARAIVGQSIDKQIAICKLVIDNGWSVRETEKYIQGQARIKTTLDYEKDILINKIQKPEQYILDLQEELISTLQLNIKINAKKENQGSITIEYNSLNDFDEIVKRLKT